jgi:hypothetical protein
MYNNIVRFLAPYIILNYYTNRNNIKFIVKLIYIHIGLLHVSANHVAIFRDNKYKG